MSEQWIRGEFEGVYVGERQSQPTAPGEARRFSFEVHSGAVRDFELLSGAAIEDELEGGLGKEGDAIRQARVRRVVLGPIEGVEVARETTLFDVHISDFRLRRPAESGTRAYGTVQGTIRARLLPAASPPADIPEPGPAAAQSTRPADAKPVAPASRRRTRRPARAAHIEGPDAAETYARARWWIALVVFAGIGLVLAIACGASIAALWAAPVLLAAALRRLLGRFALSQAWLHWPLGAALVGVQLWVLASPMAILWEQGCRAPIRAELFSLALPILGATLLRRRGWLVLTTLLWTGAMCTWCGQLDGTCTGAPALIAPAADPAPATPDADSSSWEPRSRTDASGRWPAVPGAPRASAPGAGPAFGAPIGLPGGARIGAPPRAPAPSGGPAGGPVSIAPGVGPGALADGVRVAGTVEPGDGPSRPLVGDPQPGPPAAPWNPPGARVPASAPGGSASTEGGWVAPDHRRTPRELVLISVEHANRVPESFFGNRETRRVYLPTDPIFEPGGSRIRSSGALELSRLSALLSLRPEQRIGIEVHTDAGGTEAAQLELSRRRAGAVRGWLVDRGHLDPRRLEVSGMGGGRPLVPPDGSYAAQQPNRRMEVRLID